MFECRLGKITESQNNMDRRVALLESLYINVGAIKIDIQGQMEGHSLEELILKVVIRPFKKKNPVTKRMIIV